MATNTSSPKKNPTLSALAARARSRCRIRPDSVPPVRSAIRSAAPSAMGATTGRTICACPPSDTNPSAEVTCRNARYASSTRPGVAAGTCRMSARARARSPPRSTRPMTGTTIHTSATYRFSTKSLPKAATTCGSDWPLATPVATPATVTTSSALRRSANPATTMRIPMSGSMGEFCSRGRPAV